jgi:Leucine-rich repeat (LRR) protein
MMCCLPTSAAGALPSVLFNLTRLTSLKLSNANLSGPIPDISNLTSLWELELQGNAFIGSLPAALPPNLQRMLLGSNKLTGTLPAYVGANALQYLDASYNKLSGELKPEWAGSLPELKELYLQGNNLTGTLPHEVRAACLRTNLGGSWDPRFKQHHT